MVVCIYFVMGLWGLQRPWDHPQHHTQHSVRASAFLTFPRPHEKPQRAREPRGIASLWLFVAERSRCQSGSRRFDGSRPGGRLLGVPLEKGPLETECYWR